MFKELIIYYIPLKVSEARVLAPSPRAQRRLTMGPTLIWLRGALWDSQ